MDRADRADQGEQMVIDDVPGALEGEAKTRAANMKGVRERLAALEALWESLPAEEKRARERAYEGVVAASRGHGAKPRAASEGGRPVKRSRRYGGTWRG